MPFTASEFHTYYQLKPCGLRVYFKTQGQQESEPDDYHKLLVRLGAFHERRHLESLGPYYDARGDAAATHDAVARMESVIYQPCMRITDNNFGQISGVPDFFIREEDGYVIRDCKLARRFNERDHAEIFRQLELYGWLYDQTFGRAPRRLEALMGDGQLQTVPYNPENALAVMRMIMALKGLPTEPFEPVGWSKCLDCCFNYFCIERATERKNVALLPAVDQGLATVLHEQGIDTYPALLEKYTEASLCEVKRPWGTQQRRVGNGAKTILLQARSLSSGKILHIAPLTLRPDKTLVMFDVEGIPPHLDYAARTYLWGLKAFGEKPSAYLPAFSQTGPDGDRQGWFDFLDNCHKLFEALGDVPFVHWSSYEKTQLTKYITTYGDRDGIAARVVQNLYDLLRIVENAIILPLPSYTLKLVEKLSGYNRTLTEAGGKWSMATYIEAIETDDPDKAKKLMAEIAKYNEEDLDAPWFVYQWLQSLGSPALS